MNKVPVESLVNLEEPLIKVPLEQFKKASRSAQRLVEKELGSLVTALQDLESTSSSEANKKSPQEVAAVLESFETRIKGLKRKLSEARAEEELYGSRTRARIDHLSKLSSIPSLDSDAYARWSQIRLNRLVVDYLLRMGLPRSAEKLAQDVGIKDLVDLELFAQARLIEQSIKGHSCQEALLWCKENASSLKKLKSPFEFNLRFQEFVELVRYGKLTEAIAYVKKWLTPWSQTHMKEIQQGMALLAFKPSTSCGIYRVLFDGSRWDKLIKEFKETTYALHNLTAQPLLEMTLQVGLAALKTPACYQRENKNLNCPVCLESTFGILASGLPSAQHVNSCIVCRLSGQLMNEDNPPMVLPNGYVYSTKALQAQGEDVTCPRTGKTFAIAACRKAFIS